MSSIDPTAEEISVLTSERELSVEEVSNLEAAEAVTVEEIGQGEEEAAEPTAAVEAAAQLRALEVEATTALHRTRRNVSGRYRGSRGPWRLELRVDVDGRRPTRRISGDFQRVSGATVTYFGSFIVNSVSLTVTPNQLVIEGIGNFTWNTSFSRTRVTIARRPTYQNPAPAVIQFLTPANQPGAAYGCAFESPYFRAVEYEQDQAAGTNSFVSYDTGSLPSGGPPRLLSVEGAFAEAGVQMLDSGIRNTIPIIGAGPNSRWSNAEMHAAMVAQFSLWQDIPQWKVWLLAADLHDLGPGLLGIMFDQQGRQRQGCAAFHAGLGGVNPTTADERNQLYTYVHELGHCFNLFHSFHKRFMNPPMPDRPGALSWMNYPRRFRPAHGPSGESAFWNAFPFQFDDLELTHLRHAFRSNIIMGDNPFGRGAALEDAEAFANPVEDNSGLELRLETKDSCSLGEPVVLELRLTHTDIRGKPVHTELHPNSGLVQIGIRKPNNQVVVYEPLIDQCVRPNLGLLNGDRSAIYESAYIGFGKGGFSFDQVGPYQIRAIYFALDGSQVISNVQTLRVRAPLTQEDEKVADLMFGEDQGTLLSLLGSDSESLRSGNKAFDTILEEHAKHPLAVYARLAKGTNEAREFKNLTAAREFKAREPKYAEGIESLTAVIAASEKDAGVDNITLNETLRRLARTQQLYGDDQGATKTLDRMVTIFRDRKKLRPEVIQTIEQQRKQERQGLTELVTPKPKASVKEERARAEVATGRPRSR